MDEDNPIRAYMVELQEGQIHDIIKALEESMKYLERAINAHQTRPQNSTYTEADLARLREDIRRMGLLEQYFFNVIGQPPIRIVE